MKKLWRILRALVFAVWGHRAQKDKGGRSYWHHLATVAWIAYGLTHDTEAAVVGLLHDYIEDVDQQGWYALSKRFGEATADRVFRLSRPHWEDYDQYILRVYNGDAVELSVKIADLLHNTDPSRRGTRNRAQRYQQALRLLTSKRAGLEVE